MDSLQRFIFEHAPIRGEIVHANKSYLTIMRQHNYPPMIKFLLGEALVACLLLTGSIKFKGELSLQFQGDKRFPLLLVQCDHELNVRGFAKYQEELSDEHYAEAFLQGQMVLSVKQYQQTQIYQSRVPLYSTSMSENLTHYFAQSEQISSHVWLAADDERAAGMLLQLLPEQDSTQREQFWEYAVQLGQTVSPQELLFLENSVLLHRLYHETELRLFDERSVQFKCRCSVEKMTNVVKLLGEKDANALLAEQGVVKISCDFCNQPYSFDAIDVTVLFRTS